MAGFGGRRPAWAEPARDRFHGAIAGLGFTSGVRVVIGRWEESPFGAFSDVMVQRPGRRGERVLLAPSVEIAGYVAATYRFDTIRVQPVAVYDSASGWRLSTPELEVEFEIGARTWVGRALSGVPRGLLTAPAFSAAVDPVARLLLPGVRTAGRAEPTTPAQSVASDSGSAAKSRRWEFYGAVDQRALVSAAGRWEGRELGRLGVISPPCTFGFSSTPRRPSLTRLVTTVVRREEG